MEIESIRMIENGHIKIYPASREQMEKLIEATKEILK